MSRTVAVVLVNFSTGGHSFTRGQYFKIALDCDRNNSEWVTITNSANEFRASIPRRFTLCMDEQPLVTLHQHHLLRLSNFESRVDGHPDKA